MNEGMQEKKDKVVWRQAGDPFWLERRSMFTGGK